MRKRLSSIKALFPEIQTTKDYKDILNNPAIDAVVVAVPTNFHFKITQEALQAGKHVLCEKPLAMRAEECLQLGDLAKASGKLLMTGHIFVFNQGIVKLREYIASGEMGKIHYAHSERTNLGPFRYDVNALWDLAPHDISIFNFLFNSAPVSVSARGHKCLGGNLEDLGFATIDYPDNIMVNVHVSWLDPKKVRQITVVGSQKMVAWDDLDAEGPIKLYDKHVEKTSDYYETYGEFQLLSREGSITIPKIGFNEPLKAQAQYFIQCVEKNQPPLLADAGKAADVVRTLAAIGESMNRKGELVKIMSFFKHERAISASEGAKIGEGTRVWANANILEGAVIGEHCNICDGCYVERGAVIGDHVTLKNGVAVFDGVTLEDDVFVGAGAAFINDRNPRSHRSDAWVLEKTLVQKGSHDRGQCHGDVRGDHRDLCCYRCGCVVVKNVPDYTIVVGNPARLTGYACRCGRTLNDELKCACGASYQIRNNKIVPL